MVNRFNLLVNVITRVYIMAAQKSEELTNKEIYSEKQNL